MNNLFEHQIIDAYQKDKLSYLSISKKFHIGKKKVADILKKYNINPRTSHNKDITDELIIKEYQSGKSLITLQKELHTDRPYLEKVLFSHNINLRSRAKIKIGEKFNYLTVIERVANDGNCPRYLCKCDCGNTKITRGYNLKTGRVKDCGCISEKLRRKHIKENSPLRKHGKSCTRLYSIWCGMKSRCYKKIIRRIFIMEQEVSKFALSGEIIFNLFKAGRYKMGIKMIYLLSEKMLMQIILLIIVFGFLCQHRVKTEETLDLCI